MSVGNVLGVPKRIVSVVPSPFFTTNFPWWSRRYNPYLPTRDLTVIHINIFSYMILKMKAKISKILEFVVNSSPTLQRERDFHHFTTRLL